MILSSGIYQGITPFSPKKPPVGPSAVRVAKTTGTFAPCSVVRKPLCPFRSVATYPGLTELTLMCVFRSSFAKKTVRALRAVLEALYARVGGIFAMKEVGSLLIVSEPISLDKVDNAPCLGATQQGKHGFGDCKDSENIGSEGLAQIFKREFTRRRGSFPD